MKSKILPKIFNTAISLPLSLAAVWTVLVTLKLDRTFALVIAVIAAVIISALVYMLSGAPDKKSLQNLRKSRLYALMDTLNVCTTDEILSFFSPVFSRMHISASVTDEHILLSDGKKIYPAFFPSPLSENELMSVYRKCPSDKLIVLSNEFAPSCYLLAEKLKIKLFSAEDIFVFLDDAGALPVEAETKGRKFYEGFFLRLFTRSNGTRFIFLGLTLIIIAFAVFYPVYYYVAGVISLIYGFICLFFAKNKNCQKQSLNDLLQTVSDETENKAEAKP